jgi:hypothetical protein
VVGNSFATPAEAVTEKVVTLQYRVLEAIFSAPGVVAIHDSGDATLVDGDGNSVRIA